MASSRSKSLTLEFGLRGAYCAIGRERFGADAAGKAPFLHALQPICNQCAQPLSGRFNSPASFHRYSLRHVQ